MTILLQWLVEHAWVFYVLCIIGIIPYAARALTAQRERRLALFTLERETATARVVQAWAMVFVFIAIGAAIFIGTNFVLPNLSVDNPIGTRTPTPTPKPVINISISDPVKSPDGGLIELQAQFAETWSNAGIHWQELWTVVQWQDEWDNWQDVEGW